jgi:hypothetical protein
MILPDFTDDAGLIALRRSMRAVAPGSFSPSYQPDRLTLAELEQLATDGKDVSIDDVVVLEDSTLSYKDSRVLVYIRDVADHRDDPRFHVADCTTLQWMRQINRSGRYVVATRADGHFLVNRIDKHNKIYSREIPLKICQNCLNILAFDDFSFSLPQRDRTRIVSRFTIPRFFEKYPKSLLYWRPTEDAATGPINDYPADFEDISRRVREQSGWRCERCRRDFSHPANKEYLHAHHKNGMKNENHGANLQVLCLGCHAGEPQHAHLKKLAEYREFERRFGLHG